MREAYRFAIFTATGFANIGGFGVSTGLEAVFKILLVDDEMLVRSGTAMMLDELGHDVTEAVSGKQALALIGDHPRYDLLITDFRMPDMDGMELIAAARKFIPGLKAILMTGYDADDPRFADLQAGSLSKPFGLADLEEALARAQ
jgi:CheY-like chemotaxis protein